MLRSEFEFDDEGTTVPYPPLFDDIRCNHGFVDTRGRPNLAAKIPEGTQSPALMQLLVELSKPESPLFTLGCDLGAHEDRDSEPDQHYVAGGYVQLVAASYAKLSADDYATFGWALAPAIEQNARDSEWLLRFVLKFVILKLDDFSDLIPSLWIWFYAAGRTSEAALTSRKLLSVDQ